MSRSYNFLINLKTLVVPLPLILDTPIQHMVHQLVLDSLESLPSLAIMTAIMSTSMASTLTTLSLLTLAIDVII